MVEVAVLKDRRAERETKTAGQRSFTACQAADEHVKRTKISSDSHSGHLLLTSLSEWESEEPKQTNTVKTIDCMKRRYSLCGIT